MCLSFFSAGETVNDTTSRQGVTGKEGKRAKTFHRRSEVCSRAKQRENEMFVEQSGGGVMSSGGVFLGGRNRQRHKQSPRRTGKEEKRNGENVSSAQRGLFKGEAERKRDVCRTIRRRVMSSGGVFLGGRNRQRHNQSPRRNWKRRETSENVSSAQRGLFKGEAERKRDVCRTIRRRVMS